MEDELKPVSTTSPSENEENDTPAAPSSDNVTSVDMDTATSETDIQPESEPTSYSPPPNYTVTPPPPATASNSTLGLIVMFLVGALAGFFGRPLMIPPQPVAPQVVVVTATPDVQALAQAKTNGDAQVIVVTATPEPTPDYMKEIISRSRHFQGDENAPITIIEFSDFKCGYCGRFAVQTLEQLREQYVKTGKVRFIYKQFAILGPESQRAAEATECAAEQDKFWVLHDLLFQEEATNHTPLTDEKLAELAGTVGVETTAFNTCLASGRNTDLINNDRTYIQSFGVRGTPGFLINGEYVSGAQPFEVFQEIIEKKLQELGKS